MSIVVADNGEVTLGDSDESETDLQNFLKDVSFDREASSTEDQAVQTEAEDVNSD